MARVSSGLNTRRQPNAHTALEDDALTSGEYLPLRL